MQVQFNSPNKKELVFQNEMTMNIPSLLLNDGSVTLNLFMNTSGILHKQTADKKDIIAHTSVPVTAAIKVN